MEKKIVSPFEFAICSIADPKEAKKLRTETDEEKQLRLLKKFDDFVNRIKTKDGNKATIIY